MVHEQQPETHVITDPRVLKAVSDPLRRSILSAFAEAPCTTKQVAGSLGIRTNKLYHHVDVLANAGLLRLVETRAKRGTTEKYYIAVAKHFVMDPGLLGDKSKSQTSVISAANEFLAKSSENTVTEDQHPMFVLKSSVRLTPEQIEEVQAKLEEVVSTFTEDAQEGPTYSFVAMAYPVQKGAA